MLDKLKKKNGLRMGFYNQELYDYDYLDKLSPEERNYINNFHDEEYCGTYNNNYESSVFYYSSAFDEMKKNPEAYAEFRAAHRKNNRRYVEQGRAKLSEKEFHVKLQQRAANIAKNERQDDINNNFINKTSGNTYKGGKQKKMMQNKANTKRRVAEDDASVYFELEQVAIEEKDEYANLYIALKNKKIQTFIANKLIEYYDGFKTENAKRLVNAVNNGLESYQQRKWSNMMLCEYLFRLYKHTMFLFRHDESLKELKLIDKVFDNIVYPKTDYNINKIYKD